jgi:dCTP deaminase
MTVLVDHEIASLAGGEIPIHILVDYSHRGHNLSPRILPLVTPFDPDLVNPHSLDLRIGETAKLRVMGGYKELDLSAYCADRPYMMIPGDHLLVASLESFNIPVFLEATFYLKSSRGREWYGHQLAGYIDAGWHGSKLTMEITNDDIEPLPLYFGMKFGQLAFRLLNSIPTRSYAKVGRYNNDVCVMESKG